MSDGVTLWALRYATTGEPRSLFASANVESVRRLHPDNPRFQGLSPDDRLIVSEPFSDLPGLWHEIPPSTAVTPRRGGVLEQQPFEPASSRSPGTQSLTPVMDPERAQALAETVHHGQCDPGGAPLLDHVRRVVMAVPRTARPAAWLHEVLAHSSISEETLLTEGLSLDELRALRLLARAADARSNEVFLAHVTLIASARGPGAGLAQNITRADLLDRALHPAVRPEGWSPPYGLGLQLLRRDVIALDAQPVRGAVRVVARAS